MCKFHGFFLFLIIYWVWFLINKIIGFFFCDKKVNYFFLLGEGGNWKDKVNFFFVSEQFNFFMVFEIIICYVIFLLTINCILIMLTLIFFCLAFMHQIRDNPQTFKMFRKPWINLIIIISVQICPQWQCIQVIDGRTPRTMYFNFW